MFGEDAVGQIPELVIKELLVLRVFLRSGNCVAAESV